MLTCVAAIYNATEILNFGAVKGNGISTIFFASNGKEYPFLLGWGVPQTPGPTKMCGPNTMQGMVACMSEGRFSAGGIAKAGGRVKGK